MGSSGQIALGIVGAAGRGGRFKLALDAVEAVRVQAVCDISAEGLAVAAERLGAAEQYLDYGEMLERSGVDAVIVGTPMPYHVPQAIAALNKNIHVLSEVPAGVSVDECKELVEAARRSSATYMMGENFTYRRPIQIVKEIVRQGLMGVLYYAEGEYIHELKGLNEVTRWRRTWQTGVNGITYGTHSLGPILQWMSGDRVAAVCCAGSGQNHTDPRGDRYENEGSCVMLCKMSSGGLVKIRVDMLSDRPHSTANFQLQGTDGAYESARAPGEKDRIWLRSRSGGRHEWMDLDEMAGEFLPDLWRSHGDLAASAGHGGGDLLEIIDFVDAIGRGAEPEIGIHQAMDMTLPGLVSQQSIAEGGRWLDVPDSRDW
jgi:predicted dehydrogenase